MSQNAHAEALVNEYLERKFDFGPDEAQWMGLHEYDGHVANYGKDRIERRITELEGFINQY